MSAKSKDELFAHINKSTVFYHFKGLISSSVQFFWAEHEADCFDFFCFVLQAEFFVHSIRFLNFGRFLKPTFSSFKISEISVFLIQLLIR